MIVVTNASPLIALSAVEQLQLLPQLFARVLVPTPVYQETVVENPVRDQSARIALATKVFLEVVSPQVEHTFVRKLGKGERGVLNLAL
jgi:predicted nucleic acid-binding protein